MATRYKILTERNIEDSVTDGHTTIAPSGNAVFDALALKEDILPPTDLKISTASKGGVLRCIDKATGDTAQTADGWIEDEKYGWYAHENATSTSAEFDSAVTRTGKFTLKLSTLDATGKAYAELTSGGGATFVGDKNHLISVKPNTTYKLSCWMKTNNVAANSAYINFKLWDLDYTNRVLVNFTNKATGTTDWTLYSQVFTTGANIGWFNVGCLLLVAGNISDAWFDVNSMTLEEVVVDTSFTGKVAEKIRPVLQATTSTDSIDQSLDPDGAYANTYALTNAINEGATHIQTFTPNKKYNTRIGVWPIAAGTGVDWTLVVHSAANAVLAQKTIAAASVATGAMMYFDVPFIWTTGALHFHLYASATTGTPTCKVNTSNDLETASYILNYAKKSEGFTVISNGIKTDLKSDGDGLLSNAIIDLDNGKYKFNSVYSETIGYRLANVYSTTFANTFTVSGNEGRYALSGTNVIIKVNTLLPIKRVKIQGQTTSASGSEVVTMAISKDNSTYIDVDASSAGVDKNLSAETDYVNRLNVFYVRFTQSGGGATYITTVNIEADIDTSSVPQGLFYPYTANQFTETVKLPSDASRVYFRLNKFVNENGVIMPALEFTDTTPNTIYYVPLKIDNSLETNPAVAILNSTTGYQASGTGSEEGTTYILNDGEYMTLSSATSELSVNYKVGEGTTAFTDITKTILYLSSNGESDDATQDPSHQGTFVIGVKNQGVGERVKDLGNEVADVRNGITNTRAYVQSGALTFGIDIGTTDDYAISIKDITSYTQGMVVNFKANTANTGASTLNINSLGAKALIKGVSTALSNNDILAGMFCSCVYDGTSFVLLNPRAL